MNDPSRNPSDSPVTDEEPRCESVNPFRIEEGAPLVRCVLAPGHPLPHRGLYVFDDVNPAPFQNPLQIEWPIEPVGGWPR